MHLPDPAFPPLLTGHGLKAPLDPAAEAVRGALEGRYGAGDVVWARNTARAELAIVLEPEVSLSAALQMAPLLTLATVDALAALCPPKLAILHRWPGDILLNNSLAGQISLHAPRTAATEVPAWIVVAARVDIAAPEERTDWSRTTLAEEAGEPVTRSELIEAVAAHFLRRLHHWSETGFREAHSDWLFRAAGREQALVFSAGDLAGEGRVAGLADDAALMLASDGGKVQSLPFAPHVRWVEASP